MTPLYRGDAAKVTGANFGQKMCRRLEAHIQFYRLQSHTAALNFVSPPLPGGTCSHGERRLQNDGLHD